MYKHFFKRLIDTMLAVCGLIVCGIPIIIIAIWIKLDSKGPALFKQVRLGKGQKPITVFKFRTMCDGAYEKGGIATSASDSRITKVGAFLRRTSLDELPQMFNIINGTMAIIGPRPILDWEFEEYKDKNPRYVKRYDVKQGMFCTVDVVDRSALRDQQFEMDADYAENLSFALDFKTFFSIIAPVLMQKGVYKDENKNFKKITQDMNNSYNEHLCIVFALEHYNPLNMIRAFGENGINPVYISVKRRYEVACRSKYISKLHRVDSVEEGYKLLMEEYGHEEKKPYIVFSDDKSVGYFDEHYDEWKDKFITYNAGKQGRINEFMDKYNIQQLAKKHGFNVLDSYVIGKEDPLPEGLWYPIITKDISPNSGSWKGDVFVCQNEGELKDAIKKITSPLIMIQHFVDKKNEMALEGYTVNKGKDMQIVTQMTWKYLIQGYYSPYHDVCMFTDKEMEKKLQAMFREVGFEGVFEVEFLIDKDGTFYFMETNFRASAWNPTGKFAGMPLDYLWVKGMENGCIDLADRKEFEPFTSMSEVIDYGKRVEGGMVSIAEWLRDFKDAKCVYIYDKEDRGPWDAVIENWENFK